MSDGVPAEVLAGVRSICLALPEAYEEEAWAGVRWRIRTRTFAHVLLVAEGWPPVYARAAAPAMPADGPAVVLTFRSAGPELDVLRHGGPPFFAPPWRADEVGMVLPAVLPAAVDWDEIAELLTESYCALAPKTLARRVERPGGDAAG